MASAADVGQTRLTATVAALAAFALVLPFADAAKPPHKPIKLTYRQRSIPLVDAAMDSIGSATCRDGTTVSGGGAYIPAALNQPEGLAHSTPDPLGQSTPPDEGWVGGGYNVTAPPGTLAITAICGPFGNSLKYVTRTTTVNPDGTNFAVAHCPKGTAVIGGGADMSGSSNGSQRIAASSPMPVESAKPRDGWIGAAQTVGGDSLQTLTVTAICTKDASELRYGLNEGFVGSNSAAALAATCPSGTKTVGGGAASTTTFETHVKSSSPGSLTGGAAQPSKGWVATFDGTNSGPSTVVVHAICMRART
jgi:hypothetical protein